MPKDQPIGAGKGDVVRRGLQLFLCWFPPFAWAVIILVGTSLPRVPGPDISAHNKYVHLIAYVILGLLVLRGFISGNRWPVAKAVGWTVVIGALFGAYQEIIQAFIPERSATFGDFLANLAGIVVAAGIVWIWMRIREADNIDRHSQGDGSDGGSAAHRRE